MNAQELRWLKLRDTIYADYFNTIPTQNESAAKEVENIDLYHGIKKRELVEIDVLQQHNKNLEQRLEIRNIIFNSVDRVFVVLLSDGNICLYDNKNNDINNNRNNKNNNSTTNNSSNNNSNNTTSNDNNNNNNNNKQQVVFECQQPVYDIVHATKLNCYVVVCADQHIRILNREFEEFASSPCKISRLLYNEFTNEVITFGCGAITIWCFRSTNTLLIPRKIIKENLTETDEISAVVVEKTSSLKQCCLAVQRRSVYAYELATGECVRKLTHVHNSYITTIMHFQPLNTYITGARDGSIKVWDENWILMCTFVAHSNCIMSLVAYPWALSFISLSNDSTMCVWSLTSRQQLDRVAVAPNVTRAKLLASNDLLYLFGTRTFHMYEFENLHVPFTMLGYNGVISLDSTVDQTQPVTPFVYCGDGKVRTVCTIRGVPVTTFTPPSNLTQLLYHLPDASVVGVLADGRIVKQTTGGEEKYWKANPTIERGSVEQDQRFELQITAFSIYNINNEEGDDSFMTTPKHDDSMLFVGCHDGHMVIYDWTNANNWQGIKYKLRAHRDRVMLMASNPRLNQFTTYSADTTVKVWRVFPFSAETLTPLYLVVAPLHCTHLLYCSNVLCAVYQDPVVDTYTMAMYNTTNDQVLELEHRRDADHSDEITDLSACWKLKLIATCSLDATVRVWDCRNTLVRSIHVKEAVTSLTFSSHFGDLLLGVGNNLHLLHHTKYVPRRYVLEMVSMALVENTPLHPPTHPHEDRAENEVFMKCLTFVDQIPENEQVQRDCEEMSRKKECIILEALEKELEQIKEGGLKVRGKRALTRKQLNRNFQTYLDMFYKRTQVKMPADDDNTLLDDRFAVPISKEEFSPSQRGFFAINASRKDLENVKENLRQKMSKIEEINPQEELKETAKRRCSLSHEQKHTASKGHRLSDATTYTDRLRAFQHKHTQLSRVTVPAHTSSAHVLRDFSRQAARYARHFLPEEQIPLAPDGFLPNSVIVALYKELHRQVDHEEELKSWQPKPLTDQQINEIQGIASLELSEDENLSLLEFEELSFVFEDTEEIEIPSTPEITPEPTPLPPTPTPPPPKVVKPVQPVKKLTPKPKPPPKKVTPPREPTPSPPPPPPPPPSPLPWFIVQFQDTPWFQHCFPDCNNQTFSKPRLMGNFVKILLNKVKENVDVDIKFGITQALNVLYKANPFDDEVASVVQKCLLVELNPSCTPADHKGWQQFKQCALHLLLQFGKLTFMMATEMMVNCINGTLQMRKKLLEKFKEYGLVDLNEYFSRELFVAFRVQSEAGGQTAKLQALCAGWLDEWKEKLKQHIASLTGKIARTYKQGSNDEKIIKNTSQNGNHSVSFVSNNFVQGAASHVAAIDVINYFCELKYEEELAKERLKSKPKKSKEKRPKNAVLLKDHHKYKSLVRIGETHCSTCHPDRETAFKRGHSLPDTKLHNLMLRMNRLTLNPFPRKYDELVYAPNSNCLLTLACAQKYFIPANSVDNSVKQ